MYTRIRITYTLRTYAHLHICVYTYVHMHVYIAYLYIITILLYLDRTIVNCNWNRTFCTLNGKQQLFVFPVASCVHTYVLNYVYPSRSFARAINPPATERKQIVN